MNLVRLALEVGGALGVRWLGRRFYMGGMAKQLMKMGLVSETRLGKVGAAHFFTKSSYGKSLYKSILSKEGLSGFAGSAGAKANVARAVAKYPGAAKNFASLSRNISLFNNAERIFWGAYNIKLGIDITSRLIPGLAQKVPDVDVELMNANQYILPRAAYTQRARALQAIHQSQLSTRSALGQEASYAHR